MPSLSEDVSLLPAAPDLHSRNLCGSFEHDIHTGGYDLCWSNMEEFESWKLSEEEASTIEFLCKEKVPPIGDAAHLWKKKIFFICAHGFTGGKDNYTKKTSHEHKLPAKRVGCPCRLTIKLYPHTNEVLGSYHKSHSHEIGKKNTRFTHLRKETRAEIEHLLCLGVEPHKVVSLFLFL